MVPTIASTGRFVEPILDELSQAISFHVRTKLPPNPSPRLNPDAALNIFLHTTLRPACGENASDVYASYQEWEVFPPDGWENRKFWRQYLPHVLPLVIARHSETIMSSDRLGFSVGRYLHVDGRL